MINLTGNMSDIFLDMLDKILYSDNQDFNNHIKDDFTINPIKLNNQAFFICLDQQTMMKFIIVHGVK